MELIAHRGACLDAPENSLEAFERAIAHGADRIELDVRLTRNGTPVVIHDATTARTGDRNLEVAMATDKQIAKVRLGNAEGIPTLAQALDRVAGRSALSVELKSHCKQTARVVLDVLRARGLLADTLLSSFDEEVLADLRSLGFRGRTGLIVGSKSYNPRQRTYEAWPIAALERCDATDLVIHHRLVHLFLRRRLDWKGFGLILWFSIADEEKPEHLRRRMYERAARMQPTGLVVARVAEARSVLVTV